MAAIRKTITLTEQQDEWVKARIATGDFTNDSEYFRDLIRRDQARSEELEVLRRALAEGERSGISTRSPDDILNAARERLRADGKV
jgi:antitoxin ParD1/3/4